LGNILGVFFTKLIWSPCPGATFQPTIRQLPIYYIGR
jgi:hypothetical protein